MRPTEMTTPDAMITQYSSTERLATRRGVWRPGPEGVSPTDVLRGAILDAQPTSVIEIGCGTGHLARSVMDVVPDVDYVATDLSPAMVTSAAALGVPATVAPADDLPFPDQTFDVAVAAWMLYHVPDLDAALRELRRVLRPGGVLVVATNGAEHLADLLREAGGEPLVTQFTSEVAEEMLGRHFSHVTHRDIETRATFEDHAAAVAYLATFDAELSRALPPFDGPRSYAGSTAILTAR
ncbi:class I SAM-dependent methyltransferase [Humibacillus xanthopallidus]|uniref:Methyltransferase family protein n=1 Tax=Humibacillus xanthopallidus TaxID=412689 RepID=A0A543HX44_9MICO|nr:class I SAM-dependent methyltransferase [Humibacillus xanthopallidus]TQM62839.1 methyltransferase family protein [Humibacillus xanthopallidus]